MYIISKFRDYYDIGTSVGVDKSIVYNRVQKKYEGVFIKKISYLEDIRKSFDSYNRFGFNNEAEIEILSFCGVCYPVLKYVYKPKSVISRETTHYLYDYESILEIEDKYKIKLLSSSYKNKKHNKNLFKQFEGRRDLYSFHLEYKSPIILFKNFKFFWWTRKDDTVSTNIIVNPVLKNLQFYKIMDPYTAFQEASMFITNDLVLEKKVPVEISNKDKIVKHGYNKMSFRKEKTKK